MDFQQKINQLREIITNKLTPLINSDYILLDVPYHGNIGDVLIWEGERSFLRTLPFKCVQTSSANSWCHTNSTTSDTVILLQGGGNFGDLWRYYHEFKLSIIDQFKENRIILLPQSVWYEDSTLIFKDAKILSSHKDLHLCARDIKSYEFMKKYFPENNIYLVPDMAFYIPDEILTQYRNNKSDKWLFLRRLDKELMTTTPPVLNNVSDVHDWPTIERQPYLLKVLGYCMSIQRRFPYPQFKKAFGRIIDYSADTIIRQRELRIGFSFLSKYNHVTTTRLHALILSVLLHIPVDYIDNSTGKISAFVKTWLSDVPQIRRYERN